MQSARLLTHSLIDRWRTRRIHRPSPSCPGDCVKAGAIEVRVLLRQYRISVDTDGHLPFLSPSLCLSHSRTVATRRCLCHSFDTTALPSCNAFGRVSIPICLPAMKPAPPTHRRMSSSRPCARSVVQHLGTSAVSCKWRTCAVCTKSRYNTTEHLNHFLSVRARISPTFESKSANFELYCTALLHSHPQ